MLEYSSSLDRVFQALSDPTRRAIVERLSRGEASVSELAQPFDMSLAAVVQHVKTLEDAGLVRSEKVGRTRTCRLDAATLRAAEAWLTGRRRFWEEQLDSLAQFLAEDDEKG